MTTVKTKVKPKPKIKLTPQQFCEKYLPQSWSERDLQTYVQRAIASKNIFGFFPKDEVVIPTPHSRRRADIATWTTVYEVKCWLTYDNIYHAIAQTELYTRYGGKVFLWFKKRRVIIGVAPTDSKEYDSAYRLAKDFSKLSGIEVIFINECQEWHLSTLYGSNTSKVLLLIIVLLMLFIVSFIIVVLIK